MKKYLNITSLFIFFVNLIVYLLFFNGIDIVPDSTFFPVIIGGSIIGILLSLFGMKGVSRNFSIFGNSLIHLFTVIGPLIVGFLFWSTPS